MTDEVVKLITIMDENPTVVNEDLTSPEASHAEPVEGTKEEATSSAPGTKTDSSLLLKSLQEEREKRRILEEKVNILESSQVPSDADVFSDEGKMLKKEIASLNQKITSIEEEKNLEKLYSQYPLLKEKAGEFTEYRSAEHPRAKLESVAKLFLVENGLLESPVRKGLEKTTGGSRTPTTIGMTPEEVDTLRKTNFRKYKEMLMKGQLNQ